MQVRAGFLGVATAAALALVVAGCGGGSDDSSTSSSGSSGGGSEGGTATVLMGTAPDYLDPQLGYTTQSAEPDWITYTPLADVPATRTATAGGELIPGLATALPEVSSDGLTYTLTLRRGLTFSDGRPVKASDFAYTIQRAIKSQLGRQVLLHELHRRRRRVRQRQRRARSPASRPMTPPAESRSD